MAGSSAPSEEFRPTSPGVVRCAPLGDVGCEQGRGAGPVTPLQGLDRGCPRGEVIRLKGSQTRDGKDHRATAGLDRSETATKIDRVGAIARAGVEKERAAAANAEMRHLALHQLDRGALSAVDGFSPDVAKDADPIDLRRHDMGEGQAGAVEDIEPGFDLGGMREQLGILPDPRPCAGAAGR